MVRVLLIVLTLATLNACRGDKRDIQAVQFSKTTDSGTTSDSDDVPQIKKKIKDPIVKESVIAALKQLKTMLDVSINGANPMRVEGVLITNSTSSIKVRTIISDNALFDFLDVKSGLRIEAEKSSIAMISKIAKENKMSLNFEEARLLSSGATAETISAVDSLMKNTKSAAEVYIPMGLASQSNFFKTEIEPSKRFFSAAIITAEDGNFQYFKLFDINFRPVGKIIMIPTESNKPEDQKMILEFTEDRTIDYEKNLMQRTEYVSVMHVVPVTLTR